MKWEFAFLDFIRNNISNPILDFIAILISSFGTLCILWAVLTVIFLIIKKTRRLGVAMLISFALSFIIGSCIIKPVVARIRPYDVNTAIQLIVRPEMDYSFPSGHTLFAFSSATVIFMRYRKVGIFFLIFAVLMGLSRLYLYVHFPTDVICGALLGIIIGIASHYFEKQIHRLGNKRKNT